MSRTTRRDVYRHLGDYYTDPRCWLALLSALATELGGVIPEQFSLMEPHLGGGGAMDALEDMGGRPGELLWPLEVMDLDPLAPGLARAAQLGATVTPVEPSRSLVEAGFLITEPATRPDLVILNSPYSIRPPPVTCPRCEGGGEIPPHPPHGPDWIECPRCKGKETIRPAAIPVAQRHIERAVDVSGRHVLALLDTGFLGSMGRLEMFRRLPLRAVWWLVPRPKFQLKGSGDQAEYAGFWFDKEHVGKWAGDHVQWREPGSTAYELPRSMR